MLKRLLDASLQGELEGHPLEGKAQETGSNNRRNGLSTKKVKILYGQIDITTPRDSNFRAIAH